MAPGRPWLTRAITIADRGHLNTGACLFLRRFLLIPLAWLLISCAAQHNVYLKKDSLAGISKVAVVASAKAPEVSYAQNSPWVLFVATLPPFPNWVLPASVVPSLRDASHASDIGNKVSLSNIEDQVALSFLQLLREARCFESIEYLKSSDTTASNPSTAGYDAVIKLVVDEFTFSRAHGDFVTLHVRTVGQMEILQSGKVIWDREERVKAPKPRTLKDYKDHGVNELEAMIDNGSRKLANDFIYLKHLN
jgi:hypothetical protein